MDDNNPIREAITEQVIAQCPAASEPQLDDDEYQRQFIKPWHLQGMTHLRGSIKSHDVIYCRACIEEKAKKPNIKAYRLFVTHEDDDLKNFAALCHLECQNCSYEQYVPLQKDPRIQSIPPFPGREDMFRKYMEQDKMKQYVYNQQSQLGQLGHGQAGQFGQSLSDMSAAQQNIQNQEMERRLRDIMDNQAMAANPPIVTPKEAPPPDKPIKGQSISSWWLDEAKDISPNMYEKVKKLLEK